jgi:8-oxo-dGTP pyrophosphatase MutT (NUDIX family)
MHYYLKAVFVSQAIVMNLLLFCFHKGGWETDESAEEAACREAFEEAGVQGELKVRIIQP